jgi:hypothetical protein
MVCSKLQCLKPMATQLGMEPHNEDAQVRKRDSQKGNSMDVVRTQDLLVNLVLCRERLRKAIRF